MPWYHYHDYHRMLAVTLRCEKNCLEETIMQDHNKKEKILREKRHRSLCPTPHKEEPQHEPVRPPTSSQYNLNEDLEAEVYNSLLTPMDMPVHDKDSTPVQGDFLAKSVQSNAVTLTEDRMLDEVDDNVSITSSSEEK